MMKKNLLIVFLIMGLIGMISFYFLVPRTVFVESEPIVVKDTIYRTDTVYINKRTEKKEGVSAQDFLPPHEPNKKKDTANPYRDVPLSYRIISSENNTYGYEILMNGRLYIHQPTIPGLPGASGFTSKETAMKVADLVIMKIRKNEIPPSVSVTELKKLNALK
jgi:hypothetical protein